MKLTTKTGYTARTLAAKSGKTFEETKTWLAQAVANGTMIIVDDEDLIIYEATSNNVSI